MHQKINRSVCAGSTGGLAMTQAYFTERLQLIDVDTLQDQMTIEDPVAFAGS